MSYNDFFEKEHLLENERARLEPLTPAHFDMLLPVAMHNALWEFTSVSVKNESDFRQYFDQALLEKKQRISYPWAIYDKQTQQYAGSTRYGNISFDNKRTEIGWTWYHPDLQRTGLNKNCKFLLLSYAFDTLDFNRVELKTSLTNLKSQGAMLKIGAVKEGILRRHMINANGSLRDSVYFSFIKDEWNEVRHSHFAEFVGGSGSRDNAS
jgi:RimJ/RimL family protein N-acetyltransferase